MRAVGIVLGLAALTGCGRLSFDALSMGDAAPDAQVGSDAADAAGVVVPPRHVGFAFTHADAAMTASVVTDPTEVGDVLVVEVGWDVGSVQTPTITDSHGTTFTLLGPVDTRSGNFRTYSAYGVVTVAGADTVATDLGGLADSFLQLRVMTFRDVDLAQPLDASCGTADGTSGENAVRCDLTTTRDSDMLIIYSLVDGGGSSAAAGVMDICTDEGDATSIGLAGAAGPHEIRQDTSFGEWVSNGLALRGRIAL